MGLLGWTIFFFVLALIAAVFGFGGIATAASGIAQILFFVFLVVFAITLVLSLMPKTGSRAP